MHLVETLSARVIVLAGLAVAISAPSVTGQSRDPHVVSCAKMARELYGWVDSGAERALAYHLTMAKSRGGTGHISIAEGHLVPRPRTSAPRAIADIEQYSYVMESLAESPSRPAEFPTARRDDIDLWILNSGEIELVLRSWGDTRLTVVDKTCRKDRFGYHATGFIEEGNGTRAMALSVRKE